MCNDKIDTPVVLDAAVLKSLESLDPQGTSRLIQRVLTTYLASLDRIRQQLANGRNDNDLRAILLAAHTLKSSSASVGALTLSARCAQVEGAARDGKGGELPSMVDQLIAEIGRVEVAVQGLLSA